MDRHGCWKLILQLGKVNCLIKYSSDSPFNLTYGRDQFCPNMWQLIAENIIK